MFNFVNRGLLRDEASADGAAAGGGNGNGASGAVPTFDPAAFETKLMGEFDKKLNGALKAQKNDFTKTLEKMLKPNKEEEQQHEQHKGEEQQKNGEGKSDPEKNALALELKKERETNRAAIQELQNKYKESEERGERTDRESKLRAELSKHSIAPGAMEVAIKELLPKVTRSEDKPDELIAGNLPLDKYLEVELPKSYPFFISPKDVGGAGSRQGNKGSQNTKKYDLDRNSPGYAIKPENFQKYDKAQQAEIRELMSKS